MTVQTRE